MERAISEMEKIKRAEEIYSRRNNLAEKNDTQIKNKSLYKLLFQLLLVVNIAIIIVAFQNKDYIFTKEFIEKVNSLNINVKGKVEEWLTYNEVKEIEKNDENEIQEENNVEEQNTNETLDGQGGALVENEMPELSQEEKDVKEIKEKYSIILPLEGVKTSSFGQRESNNEKVTKNHTGVDIAATTGTKIKSAITGKVTQVSEVGDYGKHLKITTDKLTILYAHCSKIYVKEGDEITQGQDVAEVGSTGNSTGPHLHFEIRFEDRYINPELILEI